MKSRLLDSIPGIRYGFGDVDSPFPDPLKGIWESRKPSWKQVHGTNVVEASSPGRDLGEADGIWTQTPGQPIAVVTADCMPILLSKKDGSKVAALHAGWRGLYANIARSFWERQSKLGERPQDWVAVIGPSIQPCCYTVSPELIERFQERYPEFPRSLIEYHTDKLNITGIQAAWLKEFGFGAVEVLNECTFCSVKKTSQTSETPRFFSYRRLGSGVRQWSAILIENP